MIELESVSKDFFGVHAVRQVSLAVAPGEIVGLVGPNGSGKTTLVNVATGAVGPTSGRVRVDGRDLTGVANRRYATAGVVRTYQGLRLFEGLSVLDNVLVGAQRTVRVSLAAALLRPPGFRRSERSLKAAALVALDQVGMAGFAGRSVTALSHGQRRRVEMARALSSAPSYIVLDEPGAGVDPEQAVALAEIVRGVRDGGAGVLLVEHDMGLVERLSDRVLGMVDGSVVAQGTFAEVARHPALASHLTAPT